jgi:DNA (cytosine-5)-methyltransferase 1
MKKYKILNLYACLGGNRYKWDEVLKEVRLDYEITAIELDPELARMYKERFPNDIVIVCDAHKYLLDHYKEFDFVWTSPPCPSHSRIRFNQAKGRNDDVYKAEYANMMLYQEIILLDNYFEGKYLVENVIPYYEPLIPAKKRGRHLYWCNFLLPNSLNERKVNIGSGTDEVNKLCKFHEIDLSGYKGEQRKDKIARNLVDYEAGKTILSVALEIYQNANKVQGCLF